jgi:hypothetical protein
VKRNKKTFLFFTFRFEAKKSQKTFILFHFKAKRKKWKRNKTKIRSFNFALVGSEKKQKEAKKIFLRERAKACETDLVLPRFAVKRKFFFAKPAHPTHAGEDSAVGRDHSYRVCMYILY